MTNDAAALVTLRVFLHRDDAELTRVRLAAAGVDSIVFADDEGGLSPGFFTDHRVRLMVRGSELARAMTELDPDVDRLLVPKEAGQAIRHHAALIAPREACGLLAIDTAGGTAAVRMVYCLTNIDASPVRFTVDPSEHYGALGHAERNGWTIGGVFHSHPKALPFPSARDIAGALDPTWFHLIIGPVRQPVLRAFRIVHGAVSDVVIVG